MGRFLPAELEVVLQAGFVYLPLLFDPATERDIGSPAKAGALLAVGGRHFVKSFSLRSLVEAYGEIDPEGYRAVCAAALERYGPFPRLPARLPDATLQAILFSIMPYFLRWRKGLARGRPREGDILEVMSREVDPPAAYRDAAAHLAHLARAEKGPGDLEGGEASPPLPAGLPVPAARLHQWLVETLERRCVQRERDRLGRLLSDLRACGPPQDRYLATLLYVADTGSLELDGFGFSRIGAGPEYLIYKRTGEYALKDFYGRLYLFPDCRVAVSTVPPLRPIVMERYKHPFLEGHEAGQPICLRGLAPVRPFSPANVIRSLEEGIDALLYGYSSRRRNGYHSLDRLGRREEAADPDRAASAEPVTDPLIPPRPMWRQDFEDYRISPDHPKIASGQVPVTNDHTP